MKSLKKLFQLALAALLALSLAAPAMADTLTEIRLLNVESMTLEHTQLGAIDTLDYDDGSVGFSLKFNFPRLETGTDTHKALREFVQHPSSVILELSIGDESYSTNNWEQDTDSQTIGLGGIYYTPNEEWATGIGLYITDTDGDGESHALGSMSNNLWSYTDSTTEFRLEQYIKGFVRLGLTFSESEYDESGNNFFAGATWTEALERDGTALDAMVNINNIVSISLAISDYDWTGSRISSWAGTDYGSGTASGTELRFGFYPGGSVALFLGLASEDGEQLLYSESTDTTSLDAEFYIGDHVDIKVGFASIDGSDNDGEKWEGDAFHASLGLKF